MFPVRARYLSFVSMPTYDYRCPDGHDFEHFFRKISDAVAELACPVCGAVAQRRVSGGAGLLFKGSGFYLTDYGKNAHRTSAPGSGGDKLDVSAVLDLAGNTWTDGGTVAAAISGGYITFTDVSGSAQLNVDIDGNAGGASAPVGRYSRRAIGGQTARGHLGRAGIPLGSRPGDRQRVSEAPHDDGGSERVCHL